MDSSQWNVMSLEAFRFYNCPDCDEKFTLKNTFVEHALMTHQVSQNYIPSILQNMMSIASVTAVTEDSRMTKSVTETLKHKLDLSGVTITKTKKKRGKKSKKAKVIERPMPHKRLRDKIDELKSYGVTITRSPKTLGEIVNKPSVTLIKRPLPFKNYSNGVTNFEKYVTKSHVTQKKNENVTFDPNVTIPDFNKVLKLNESVTITKINDIVTPPLPNVTQMKLNETVTSNSSVTIPDFNEVLKLNESVTITKMNDIVTPSLPNVTQMKLNKTVTSNLSVTIPKMNDSVTANSSVTIPKMNDSVTPNSSVTFPKINDTVTPIPNVTQLKLNETVTSNSSVTVPKINDIVTPVLILPEKENNNNFTKGIEHKLRNKKQFNYGSYKCGICQKSVQSTEQLKLHIDVVHLGTKDMEFHRCEHCPQKFKKKSLLNKHVIMNHLVDERKFKCDTCHKKYKRKSTLGLHKSKVHPDMSEV